MYFLISILLILLGVVIGYFLFSPTPPKNDFSYHYFDDD